MTTIHDAYINALLADASYVSDLIPSDTSDNLTLALTDRMTPELAKYIGDNFTVVTQVGGLASSFDATVWKDKSGQYYVSMRGTQEGPDFTEDGDLAVSGLAHHQLVDMVNWWLRETTPTNAMAIQVKLDPNSITLNFVVAPSVQGTGELAEISTIKSVNGHSLGGYLATAFDRLFGNKWPIDVVNTFNSAGFSRPMSDHIADGFTQLSQVIGAEVGLYSFNEITATEQNNYFAQNGVNVTTNTWNPVGFQQYGKRIGLFQEDLTPGIINNHFMYKLTDLLSLGNAMEQLDPTMDMAKLNAIVSAGSNQMIASYEGVLDGLRKMLLGATVTSTLPSDANAPNGQQQPDARLDYQTKLKALTDSNQFISLKNKVAISSVLPDASTARTDFGAFLGLYSLTPFSLKGGSEVETALANAWNTQYIDWLADKNLSDVDRANGQAHFTDEYLVDRAAMLSVVLKRNAADFSGTAMGGPDILFKDYASNTQILLKSSIMDPIDKRNILFGSDSTDNGDNLNGGSKSDRLYGGAGNDTLSGKDGNDYLEGDGNNDSIDGGIGTDTLLGGSGDDTLIGGKDNDFLKGGEGNDTYKFSKGDGWDVITDSDGKGSIVIGDTTLTGGKEKVKGSGLWYSADEKYAYSKFTESDGSTTLNIVTLESSNDRIFIKNYTDSKNLGIVLEDGTAADAPQFDRTIVGDLTTIDFDPVKPGIQDHLDDIGNDIVDPSQPEPDKSDGFYGSAGNDLIKSGGGADYIVNNQGGNDRIEAGSGNDIVNAEVSGTGNEVMLGGAGQDLLMGRKGDDHLYADAEIDVGVAIEQGRSQDGTGAAGDWLAGGTGDDIVVGAGGDDTLFGSRGSGILVGGASVDILMGNVSTQCSSTKVNAQSGLQMVEVINNKNWRLAA